MSFGRFNSAGDTRTSAWTNITEIEFYGDAALSVDDFNADQFTLYPNPVKDLLTVRMNKSVDITSYQIVGLDGRLISKETLDRSNSTFTINVSKLAQGTYFLNLYNSVGNRVSKKIIVN